MTGRFGWAPRATVVPALARATQAWHAWPVYLVRYYVARTWRDLPGPWPVKVALLVLCLAIPGPFDELALVALPGVMRRWRESRA